MPISWAVINHYDNVEFILYDFFSVQKNAFVMHSFKKQSIIRQYKKFLINKNLKD